MAMNKQRRSSNIANIFSYDDAGNIVIKDYGQVTRYSWNGLIHGFVGPLSISSVSAATTDTDRFLVSDGGVLKYRTGVELLSDIGGVPSTRTLTINGVTQDLSVNRTFTIAAGISGSGADGQVAYWNGTNSQTGSNNLFWDAANSRLGIGTNTPARTLSIFGDFQTQSANANNSTFAVTSNTFGASLSVTGGSANTRLLYVAPASGETRFLISGVSSQINIWNSSAVQSVVLSSNTFSYINSGQNFAIGGTTDSGQRLQVYGDAFVRGSTTDTAIALRVENSASSLLFRVLNNGSLRIGNTGFIYPTLDVATNADLTGTNLAFYSLNTSALTTNGRFFIGGEAMIPTSGNSRHLYSDLTFSPTSGNATNTNLYLRSFVNQMGGANGITRGLFIDPAISSADDWRSIEWSNNTGWGLYGAGTANNLLNGNLGIASSPLAWPATFKVLQFSSGSLGSSTDQNNLVLAYNYFFNGTNTTYRTNGHASGYQQYLGAHNFYTAPNGTAGNVFTLTQAMTLTNAGRLLLGDTTDGTQRLQVYGDAFVKGSGATSATNALLVQNSNGTELLRIQNDGTTIARAIGNNNTTPIFAATQQNGNTRFSVNALGQTFIGGDANAATDTLLRIERNFNPTSGTATHITTLIIPTINQTGGANGITRGLYVNPTLTAAADWRSIEWSNNSGWGLYGAGTANNYLNGNLGLGETSPLYPIHVIKSGNNFTSAVIAVRNNSNGVFASAEFRAENDLGKSSRMVKLGSGYTAYKSLSADDLGFYNDSTGGNISILNDTTTGKISLTAGGSSTAQMTLTAAGRLLLGTVDEGTFLLDVNGTARVSGATTINGNTTINYDTQYASISGDANLFIKSGTTLANGVIGLTGNGFILQAKDGASNAYNILLQPYGGNVLVGTSANIASAKLVVTSTTQGFLPPRMTTTQRDAIATPATGLSVYNTTTLSNNTYNGTAWLSEVNLTAAGRLLLGGAIESTFLLDVNGTSRFSDKLSVIATATTNDVALFRSVEPYITIEAVGGSNPASIFFRPSTSAQNATIQNRTGGGIDLYTGITPSLSLEIKSSGAVVASSTLGLNGVEDSVKSGKYTPTLTNSTNVASSAVNDNVFKYIRVGSTVHVSGWVTITATASNTLTELELSLPIASNITSNEDVSGVANTLSGGYGQVRENATNNTAKMYVQPTSTSNLVWYLEFSYVII